MATEAFILDKKDYNEDTRRWSVSALSIPNSNLVRLESNNEVVHEQLYKIDGRFIDFAPGFDLEPDNAVIAFIEVNSKRTRFQINSAIAVAFIGLLGTVFQVAFPDFIKYITGDDKNKDLVSIYSPQFGLIDDDKRFIYTFGSREISEHRSFFPREHLDTHKFWFALRLRELTDIKEYRFETGAKGPYDFNHGIVETFEVPKELCELARAKKKNVQLVVIKTKQHVDLSKPFTLKNLSDSARAVHVPSEALHSTTTC